MIRVTFEAGPLSFEAETDAGYNPDALSDICTRLASAIATTLKDPETRAAFAAMVPDLDDDDEDE